MHRTEEEVMLNQKTYCVDNFCQLEDSSSVEYLTPGFSDSWTVYEEVAIFIPEFFKIQDPKGARKP